jgi:serine/threonine protein kinase
MSSTPACPDETQLLALAIGEPIDAAVAAHADECAHCRAKRDRFQSDVALLREHHGGVTTHPSTEDRPAVCREGSPPGAGTTQDWMRADSAATLDTDSVGPEATTTNSDHAEAHSAVPDAIGRYKVVGRLGAGGEAEVYRVVHIKLGNDLVLKLSRRRVGADNHVGLVEEGRLLVDLEHPNLVRIYDLDFHDDRPFLVMEYVHGRDLQQYASEEPVTPRRAAALVGKLAEVMAVAHRHGITHCDIKPKNVLVDKLGEPRLIDFGMARLRHAWSDHTERSVGGTIAYMAPEQARLENDRIGPRSDIFALGGVLYFLLTGHAPYGGETQQEVWDRARRCDFAAGALRAAKVPRPLQRICLKAMAADPASRYATAEALAKALDSYLRRPLLIAALAVIVLTPAVALGLWSGWSSPPPSPGPARGRHPAVAQSPLASRLTDEKPGAKSNSSSAVAPTPLDGQWEFENPDAGMNHASANTPAPPTGPLEGENPVAGMTHSSAVAPTPLTGELTVRVWSKANGGKQGLKVDEPGALPLLAGEQVHLEARVNQPAYPYVLWLDGQGHVSLLYPHRDQKFGGRPSGTSARVTVDCPEAVDEGFRMIGPGGLETALLLVRRTPLPPDIDLTVSIGRLPPSPLRNPLEVAKRGGNEGQPIAALQISLHRGINEAQTEKIDDPLLQLMQRLRTENQFEVVRAVRFAYKGE